MNEEGQGKKEKPSIMARDSKISILNVDDNEPGRYAVSRILKQAGFEVLEAASGEEALRLVDKNPNLIILDVQLPGIDGFEVCKRIRANPKISHIPILHLSATYIDVESTVKGLEGGADNYLTQPVEPIVLIAAIKALLRMREAEAEAVWELEVNRSIVNLSKLLIQKDSIENISFAILQYANHLTESKFGFVGYIDPKTGYLVTTTMTRDIWDICQVEDKNIIFKKFGGLWGWILNNRKPILTNKPGEDPRSSGTPRGHISIDRFLSVPAMAEEALIGQIAVANSVRDYREQDLLLLEQLARLYAIAVDRYWAEQKKERLLFDLQASLKKIKKLSGLLPICASCKKIRDDKGYWTQIEAYVRDRSEADFSHGICPECAEKLYPDFSEKSTP